ncbi:MAG: acyltransferase domain-containing protein, partial [Anaerolineae bacterium]|nr:acyltransferase domain-containing protein [Anaerolineae bacterium]
MERGRYGLFFQGVFMKPIAIIGLAALAPKALTLQEYWDNIVNAVDCITDVPPSRWEIDDYYSPDITAPDKTYCKRGGFLPDIDFDPVEFGLPPNILEVTDVSQLLSLLVARDALADAGYRDASPEIRQRTGVILGVGGGQKLITPLTGRLQYPIWEKVLKSMGLSDADVNRAIEKMKLAYIPWEENSFPGMLGNVIAGRIANRLDLGGVNCVVDAACASSLSALRMAIGELNDGKADMMISGGVDTDNSIFMYMSFSKTPAFSKANQIRPFDAESDGMMIGEGLGMVVLKRLEDAERDGDTIYAVIKALGASSDGKYKSIYAPRDTGQVLALQRAYDEAGFSPSTIGLVEAHGTGTMAGDITEFNSLNLLMQDHPTPAQSIALGSVKSQIGHTKSAAGAMSLIKAALALHHKVLPPTLNIQKPNPKLNIEQTPFYLNTETRPWIRPEGAPPRRAGVSSFGFGGTNFHVVLEEYGDESPSAHRIHRTADMILLTADNPQGLVAHIQDVMNQLNNGDARNYYNALVEAGQSVQIGDNQPRVGFVANGIDQTVQLLNMALTMLNKNLEAEAWTHPKGVYYRKFGVETDGRVVALFSGQGSQYVGMGRELALNFPEMRDSYGEIDALFLADEGHSLSSLIYPPAVFTDADKEAQTDRLKQTNTAQPAIGAMSMGLYRVLRKAGFSPNFTAGHSFGELTALWAAEVINDADFVRLMKARGDAMAPLDTPNFDPGTMLAVTGDLSNLEADLNGIDGVGIANKNAHNQVVLAGATPAIQNAHATL